MSSRVCINPGCARRFKPAHRGHYWCEGFCRQGHYKAETGLELSGGLGVLSDPNAIRAFEDKWVKASGRRSKPTKKKAIACPPRASTT